MRMFSLGRANRSRATLGPGFAAQTVPAKHAPESVVEMSSQMRALSQQVAPSVVQVLVSGYVRRGSRVATLTPDGNGEPVPVIFIGLMEDNHDRQLLANVSARNGWVVHFVDALTQAQAAAANLRVPVILCDRDLAGADWRETVSRLASSAYLRNSNLPSGG
jgi:hypothetical protein